MTKQYKSNNCTHRSIITFNSGTSHSGQVVPSILLFFNNYQNVTVATHHYEDGYEEEGRVCYSKGKRVHKSEIKFAF